MHIYTNILINVRYWDMCDRDRLSSFILSNRLKKEDLSHFAGISQFAQRSLLIHNKIVQINGKKKYSVYANYWLRG